MKALKIIEEMVFDSAFAEVAATLQYNTEAYGEEEFVNSWFGCTIKEGKIENMQNYLYMYQVDSNKCVRAVVKMGKPDVILERLNPEEADSDDQEVWLWKIE